MKKRKILNICMILSILLVVACGFMAVGSVKGWFDKSQKVQSEGGTISSAQAVWKVGKKTGIVTVERNGIAYEIEKDTVIRKSDILYTKNASEVSITDDENQTIVLSANSELQVNDVEKRAFILAEGEAFAEISDMESSAVIMTENAEILAKNAVFSVSAQAASNTVYVYAGELTIENEKFSDSVMAEAGEEVSILTDETGNIAVETNLLRAGALSDAQIRSLQNCSLESDLCFSKSDLQAVVENREAEKMAAQEALLLLEEQARENLEQEQKKYEDRLKAQTAQAAAGSSGGSSTDSGNSDANSSQNQESSGSSSSGSSSSDEDETDYGYCTITIRCDTILDNMGNLTAGKEVYVPSNGVILATSKIEFTEGETVFEVLKKACSRADIQLEYSWTPLYESYYIEGINHLYEFDCGNESGWMYKVNGWFPNYGCSSYELSDGDTIVWCYTSNGLGEDVGR